MKKLLLGLFFSSPILLLAQGLQVNTQSQKAAGMAGAGSALFVDETSIFYNPGAVSKMDHNALSAGASALMYRAAFRELNSNDVHHTKFKISPPFSVFATVGPQDSWWKAGLGIYTPFAISLDWGDQWPGRYELNHLHMQAIYIQPTLSFKLTENFGIGGGFVYNVGLVDLSRSIPLASADGTSGRAELSGVGTGTGFNVGIHYNLEDDFAFSVSYRSQVTTKLKDGDAKFSVPSALTASYPTTTFDTEVPLPSSFNVGITFPAGERVDIAADATFIGYSLYKELVLDYTDNTTVLEDTRQVKNYENAFSVKTGINVEASEKLDLRAGVGYVYTPVRGPYVSPDTPDNNRIMGSVGFTYDINHRWDLTGAYVFQQLFERTVKSANTGLAGSYKTNIHAPGVSLTYKW